VLTHVRGPQERQPNEHAGKLDGGLMSEVEVRPAQPEDREAVLAFCERTWDDGDYISQVWDEWLADTEGALLVGVLDARPVALIHMRMVSAHEGWLEGIRVEASVRHQGIGRTITSRALVAAREREVVVVRLFTDSDNTSAQRLVAGLGFQQVASFVGYEAPATAAQGDEAVPAGAALRTPGTAELGRVWAFLEASNLVPLNGGLLVARWTARALTRPLLEQRLAAGEVCVLEAWGAIQALAVTAAQPQARRGAYLAVEYLDGTSEGVGRLALALRGEALRQGLGFVRVTLPDALMLHDAMAGAGYARRHDGATWCYARRL
jgi:ribosomal protein S18 acetylase RimI-like enzyme